MKEIKYKVHGIHCASCELIIEHKLLELPGVKAAAVAGNQNTVLIEYESGKPDKYQLNKLFKSHGYTFASLGEPIGPVKNANWLIVILCLIAASLIYFLVQKAGLSSWVRVDARSSLPTFFVFGLLAGVSTCAALVGGLILGMSKNWSQIHDQDAKLAKKIEPHLLFNSGRLVSYVLFGAVLGGIGRFLKISPNVSAAIIILISVVMLYLALQMLGITALKALRLSAPKSISRFVANENNFRGLFMPAALGFLTFFLPCGFTLTVQSLALISGSAVQGALIMLAFVLGTLIPLLLIGLGSTKLYEHPAWSENFSRIAAVLLIIFSIFNFNAGLNILGTKLLPSSIGAKTPASSQDNEQVNGFQVIKMMADSQGYQPNYFKLKVGIPVRWEITDSGATGCTSTLISKDMFAGQISLVSGRTVTKEFTPTRVGKFRFSCWMGMVNGVFEVTE